MEFDYGKNKEIKLEAIQPDFAAVAAMIVPLPMGLVPSKRFRAALRRRLLYKRSATLSCCPLRGFGRWKPPRGSSRGRV